MTRARHSRGFTLIASLLMLVLLSGIAIGLMMMVTTEGKVGGVDLQNNVAYHNAEGGIEKMTSDLAAAFQSAQSPTAQDICDLSLKSPAIVGVTWKDYQVQPSTGCGPLGVVPYGQIDSGPNQGLWAQIIPVTMLATAAQAGGQEVSMMRTAQVALIPVFQFGVFSDSDLSFFSGPNFDFAGRVHTNGDLYPEVGNGSTLRFHDKVTAYGNVIRANLANGLDTAANYAGTVLVPTDTQGCDPGHTSCRALARTEGSVVGAGGNPPQSANNWGVWQPVSVTSYNREILNGNFGLQTGTPPHGGTGAKRLQLPFVNGADQPFEIIRRKRNADSSGLAASREYNMAQIRVLISDDPADLPKGAGDPDNVRLANVPGGQYPNGIPTSTPAGLPVLPVGQTYNTYFAAGSSAIPDASACTLLPGPICGTSAVPIAVPWDWAMAPANAPLGAQTLVPAGAPNLTPLAAPLPILSMCPPANLSSTVPPLPAGCPPYPYEVTQNLGSASTWNLIDGYLRVEYRDAAGVWNGVTREWLGLGFARGTLPPTAPGANPVNPSAILILQQPADRNADGNVDAAGLAPVCTHTVVGGVDNGKCDKWNYGRPPEVIKEAGSNNPFVERTIGFVNPGITKNNWYPINFYDTREGEARDVGNNGSCSTIGVMNAVEIDVGNLKRWLWGQIGVNGPNVDFKAQNGWVLYFSDRRGMLNNPNPPFAGAEKSGDSGLEDVINAANAAGTPDGALEPKGTKAFSPEDVSQNNLPEFYGAANMGLGFYNVPAPGNSLNAAITAAAPDNPYVRINSCMNTARKNWVSGARHVLKLVDGSFGNVPYRQDGTLTSPGGFTVASENPVYIYGDYNSNAADPAWGGGADLPGHAAASVIADAVTLLSNNWSDINSFLNPTNVGARVGTATYYRLAIAGGKNINFPKPAYCPGAACGQDYGTDGGTHNFLRYLESWGQPLWYKGSLVSLYYSTYNTGAFKCCNTVYGPPPRNYSFDADFALPGGLPPGTPMFRDVDTLGYRQMFATRTY